MKLRCAVLVAALLMLVAPSARASDCMDLGNTIGGLPGSICTMSCFIVDDWAQWYGECLDGWGHYFGWNDCSYELGRLNGAMTNYVNDCMPRLM